MDDRSGDMPWIGGELVSSSPLNSANSIAQRVQFAPADAIEPVTQLRGQYALSKRVIDIAGTIALALVFSPVLIVVSIALSKGRGGVLFRHTRIGKDGKEFKIYKFRSMVPNADQVLKELIANDAELRQEWLRDHKLKEDPRVTGVGRFLRRTSLDELPQLWNVLKGEMSLVGPRPIIREELYKYGRAARYYLALKPGLTGIWQVSGRNDTDYNRRVAMDRHYVSIASLSTDLLVLAKTVDVVLRRRGAY
jgi:Undecaprenyl-phosphate galactose phosphotransferase WbaP